MEGQQRWQQHGGQHGQAEDSLGRPTRGSAHAHGAAKHGDVVLPSAVAAHPARQPKAMFVHGF
jgi:hypothetical protein